MQAVEPVVDSSRYFVAKVSGTAAGMAIINMPQQTVAGVVD